jgi:DNA (cytosine-5)-methyltransferase 1
LKYTSNKIEIKAVTTKMNGTRKKINESQDIKIVAVDLFCGAGGLTKGLRDAGIDVRLGIDIDPACEYPYRANNRARFHQKSVENVTAKDVEKVFKLGAIRLLAGCAPCQPFSMYNQKADSTDKRWWLLHEFSRLVKELLPDLVTMENVPRIKYQSVFKDFVKDLEDAEYKVDVQIVNCAEFGIPQHRRRLVLLASRIGKIELLTSDEFDAKSMTVNQAIGELPPLRAGEMCQNDQLHRCSALSSKNLQRIKTSIPGGTWRDWDDKLVADCHKKKTGYTYPSVYGRMSWNEPSPTITTQFYGFGNGRFGHPEQDRAISLREGAILQSFPADYKFVPDGQPIHTRTIGRLVGNAVPVKLGELIGKSIFKHVSDIRKYKDNGV